MSGLSGFGSSPVSLRSFSPRPERLADLSPSSSSAASPVMDSTSPTLATACSRLDLAPASEVIPGPVPSTTRTYVAPGGEYVSLSFRHTFGCQNAMNSEIESFVRRIIARSSSRTMKEVQVAPDVLLLSKRCRSGCGLDKDSTTVLFVHYVSYHCSFYTRSLLLSALAPSPRGDSQHVVPEFSFTPNLPDGLFELPAAALSSKPALVAVESPTTTPSISSLLADLSSDHPKMYKLKGKHGFHQDRDSDEDYVPAALRPPPRRARSLSPTKKAIPQQDRTKRLAVPLIPDLNGPFRCFRFPQPWSLQATYTDPSPVCPVLPTPTPAPDTIVSVPTSFPGADVLPSSEVARDMPMALGSDRNSEATRLGDNIHAVRTVSPSQAPSGSFSEWSVSILVSDRTTMTALPNPQEQLDMPSEE